MKSILTMAFIAVASAASAHPSLIAHDHPHESSMLGGLDLVLLAVVLTAVALVAWQKAKA